jgi:hypothetical protein
MSLGRGRSIYGNVASHALDKIEADPELRAAVARFQRVDSDYDIPYVGGYSLDGTTVYRDRHLPDVIEHEEDGRKYKIDTVRRLMIHEPWEKALIDVRGWTYDQAHRIAEALEDRRGAHEGIPRSVAAAAFKPYIKADEHEKLVKCPPDLDMTPYREPVPDRRLIARIYEAQGKDKGKKFKDDPSIEYTKYGSPAEHCGKCSMYVQGGECTAVRGHIDYMGVCKIFEAKKEKKR